MPAVRTQSWSSGSQQRGRDPLAHLHDFDLYGGLGVRCYVSGGCALFRAEACAVSGALSHPARYSYSVRAAPRPGSSYRTASEAGLNVASWRPAGGRERSESSLNAQALMASTTAPRAASSASRRRTTAGGCTCASIPSGTIAGAHSSSGRTSCCRRPRPRRERPRRAGGARSRIGR